MLLKALFIARKGEELTVRFYKSRDRYLGYGHIFGNPGDPVQKGNKNEASVAYTDILIKFYCVMKGHQE